MDKHFTLDQWLLKTSSKVVQSQELSTKSFLSPYWSGTELVSQELTKLSFQLNQIQADAKNQLVSHPSLKLEIKNQLFEYYQCFYQALTQTELPSCTTEEFWKQLASEEKDKNLTSFLDFYCFHIAFIFHLKQRFLIRAALGKGFQLYDSYFSNLNTFFSKLLPHGSKNELNLESFSANTYNWYQPNFYLLPLLKDMALSSQTGSLETSFEMFYYFLKRKCPYQIRQALKGKYHLHDLTDFTSELVHHIPNHLKIFPGTYVKPMSYHRVHYKGDQILKAALSSFKSSKNTDLYCFESTLSDLCIDINFINLVSELFFLNKRVNISFTDDEQKNLSQFFKASSPVSEKAFQYSATYDLLGNTHQKQKTYLVYQVQDSFEKCHHQLIKEVQSLASKGIFFVFCPKPLFLPSAKEKSKQLLKLVNLKAHISFENVNGMPQYPAHIYLFQKYGASEVELKQSHFHFQFRGKLDFEDQIQEVNHLFAQFFKKSQDKYPMVFSRQSENIDLSLDFFQDAIVDGQLMSASHNSQQLTHPHFFQGITQKCIPLESLFKTPGLQDFSDKKNYPLLQDAPNLPPFVIVINHNNRNQFMTKVDIIPGESYPGYKDEHGSVDNQYFALIPKHHDLNVSLLRSFFKSSIGQQIADLCFCGNNHNRTKIKTLLVPKFFSHFEQMPQNVSAGIKFLETPYNELAELSPQIIFANFKKIEPYIEELFIHYPLTILGSLKRFQHHLSKQIKLNESETNFYINFYQPQLITELTALTTQPVLPKHPDLFIDFHISNQELGLEVTSFKNIMDGQKDHYRIDLFHNDRLLVSLHTTKYLSTFVGFLLKQMIGLPLNQLLKSFNLPSEQQLAEILPSYTLDYTLLKELSLKCSLLMEQLFKRFIINKS